MSSSPQGPPPPLPEPWLEKLRQGEPEAAWDLLINRYHRLIAATVRHFVEGHDEVMDVFTYVCESLRANDSARLRKYAALTDGRVRFSTWLVAVVRNLVVDWLRRRDGRKRPSKSVRELPPQQREAFEKVYLDGHSPGEAYEILRTRGDETGSFGEFLDKLANAHRAVKAKQPGGVFPESGSRRWPPQNEELKAHLEAEAPSPSRVLDRKLFREEIRNRLDPALETLSAEDRVALQLYVIDELPAEDVARLLGWKTAKTVYNRVYRALAALRSRLREEDLTD